MEEEGKEWDFFTAAKYSDNFLPFLLHMKFN